MVKAYILITTKPGTSENVVKALREIEEVKDADSVYGRYDVIAIIEGPDLRTLSEIIYKRIETIPNIIRTETAITLGK
jgi:DNA-binding Lrp family transcriptional regulator